MYHMKSCLTSDPWETIYLECLKLQICHHKIFLRPVNEAAWHGFLQQYAACMCLQLRHRTQLFPEWQSKEITAQMSFGCKSDFTLHKSCNIPSFSEQDCSSFRKIWCGSTHRPRPTDSEIHWTHLTVSPNFSSFSTVLSLKRRLTGTVCLGFPREYYNYLKILQCHVLLLYS